MKNIRKKLLIGIPLLALGLGGIAGGGIAIAGYVFNVGPLAIDKIDIKNDIFAKDTNHWKTTTPAPTTGAYVWDEVLGEQPNENNIINFLGVYASTAGYANVVNQLEVTGITSTDHSWNTADVSVNPKSRQFTGSFTFFFELNTTPAVGNLASDLSTKSLDLSDTTTGSTNLTNAEFLRKLGDVNSNLNINAIEIVKTDDNTKYTNGFGVNYGISLTNFWNTTNDDYENITIRAKEGDTWYGNQSVNGITLKLKRAELSAQQNWKNDWSNNNSFRFEPNDLDIQTRFDELYEHETWYAHLDLDDTYADTWGFVIDTGMSIFYISGNPYWNSQNDKTIDTATDGYKFDYQLITKINLSSQMINSSSVAITSLEFVSDKNWDDHPDQFKRDVYDKLHATVNTSVWPNIAWLDIQTYSFDDIATTITLTPYATSGIYTNNAWTVSYTIQV